MGYAYLDQYGILHVTGTEETAMKYGQGKVIATAIKASGGFPIVQHNGETKDVVVRGRNDVTLRGVIESADVKVSLSKYSEIKQVYEQLV